MPLWLATALMSVGAVVLGAALRNGDWAAVGIALAAGVATAAYVRGYYTTSVLERSRGRAVIETVKIRGVSAFEPSTVEPRESAAEVESVAHEAIDEAAPEPYLRRIAPYALLLLWVAAVGVANALIKSKTPTAGVLAVVAIPLVASVYYVVDRKRQPRRPAIVNSSSEGQRQLEERAPAAKSPPVIAPPAPAVSEPSSPAVEQTDPNPRVAFPMPPKASTPPPSDRSGVRQASSTRRTPRGDRV